MISGYTRVNALLANPSKHSLSPLIHNYAYQLDGLDYVYVTYEVSNIKEAIIGAKALGINGLNISMPFKEKIIPFLDELDESSSLTNSVNTVVLKDNKYIGYNTDGVGLYHSLLMQDIDISNSNICILGSGGAAISIIATFAAYCKKEITIFKRNIDEPTFIDKIHHIKNSIDCNINIKDINNDKSLLETMNVSDVIIQATSVGMGNTDSVVSSSDYFNKNSIVVDIIYNPFETTFLKFAKQKGCKCFNGLDMLLHQGAIAHELFTGSKMNLEECKRVMEDFLCKK